MYHCLHTVIGHVSVYTLVSPYTVYTAHEHAFNRQLPFQSAAELLV